MAVAGTIDAPLEIFGGLCTDMSPADLPPGVSPDCADVSFVPGSVKTRPGLLSIFTPIGGVPAVNYLKTYITQTSLLRLLALDAAGSLWKENPQGVLSLISSSIVPATYGKSASLFTREYLAIGDGKFGLDIPRQFDDTNLDRVSQEGPGVAPGAVDEVFSQTVLASPNGVIPFSTAIAGSPNGLIQTGFVVTLKTNILSGFFPYLRVGDPIQVTGAGVGGYNGTWNITSLSDDGQTLQYVATTSGLAASGGGTLNMPLAQYVWSAASTATYADGQLVNVTGMGVAGYNTNGQIVRASTIPNTVGYGGYKVGDADINAFIGSGAFGLAASGNGTVTNAGNVTAGVHKLTVAFLTRQGYITVPAPPAQWTAAGSKRVVVSNIVTGPPNVVARVLLFSLAGQTSYFYAKSITGVATSNLIIQDNTTTTVTVDFSDVGLAAQINGDYLFRLLELGECSGVLDYAQRLFWWGERNKVNTSEGGGGFNNLSFDGGFTGNTTVPAGWVRDATNGAGGQSAIAGGQTAFWGDAYVITSNAGGTNWGKITQSAFQDVNGIPILLPNTAYSVRARIKRTSSALGGSLTINLHSANSAITTVGLVVTAGTATTSYVEYTASLTDNPLSSIPSDLVLQLFATPTPAGSSFVVDCVEVFPTTQPNNTALVRASQVELPENYDGINGFLQVSENDGFAVRTAFILRENLYFVKEHGVYKTQDDGVNEPSGWKVTEVSRKVGTPSVNGAAVGEDWAVIADKTGLYFTTGGEPSKISQEIQPTWDRINWNFGYKLWVQVDVQNRRIYVGVPLDTATTPNVILMMDYRGIERPDEIATAGPIHTSYSGKLLVLEKSRKWSIWNIQAASGAMVLRFDGSEKLFVGNSVGNGKIYQLTETQLTDDGAAIPGYYTTYFHFTHDIEQAFQLGSHNKLYTYLSMFAEGSGQLLIAPVLPGSSPINPVASIGLVNPAVRDLEFPINVTAVRSAFKVSTSNAGDWFRLARFIANAVKHPSAPTRGWN